MTDAFKKQGFSLCLIGAVALGWLMPDWGASGGILRTEISTRAGVMVIFFLQGLLLPRERFAEGLADGRLHAFVLASNYILAPLAGIAVAAIGALWLPRELTWGILYLAVLPTTISSAVAFTAVAGGNVTGAIFSSALSNILGVVVTPLGVSLLIMEGSGEGLAYGPLFGKLFMLIILPMAVGQVLHGPSARIHTSIKRWSGPLNSGIICFIVFAAFANSAHSAAWTQLGFAQLAGLMALALLFMATTSWLTWAAAGKLMRTHASRIAAFYCGSQKTLAAGVPMAAAIFTGLPAAENLGILLVPLLVCHPAQLLLASAMLPRVVSRAPGDAA